MCVHPHLAELKSANIGLVTELAKARAECLQLRSSLEQQARTIRGDTKLIADLRRVLEEALAELAGTRNDPRTRAAG
jgi:hypothetical protein